MFLSHDHGYYLAEVRGTHRKQREETDLHQIDQPLEMEVLREGQAFNSFPR